MGVAHSNEEVCAYPIHGVFGVVQRPICRCDRLREKKSCGKLDFTICKLGICPSIVALFEFCVERCLTANDDDYIRE